jgi:hypothetical protein
MIHSCRRPHNEDLVETKGTNERRSNERKKNKKPGPGIGNYTMQENPGNRWRDVEGINKEDGMLWMLSGK